MNKFTKCRRFLDELILIEYTDFCFSGPNFTTGKTNPSLKPYNNGLLPVDCIRSEFRIVIKNYIKISLKSSLDAYIGYRYTIIEGPIHIFKVVDISIRY